MSSQKQTSDQSFASRGNRSLLVGSPTLCILTCSHSFTEVQEDKAAGTSNTGRRQAQSLGAGRRVRHILISMAVGTHVRW